MPSNPIRGEAELLWKAGFSNKFNNVEAIELLVLHSKRIGINSLSLLTSATIKEDKIVMDVEAILAIIKSSTVKLELEGPYFNHDGEFSTVIIKRKGIQYRSTFSMDDADRLNLLQKRTWVENPLRMRRNRALIDSIRQAFPEFVVGVVLEDELESSFYCKAKTFLNFLSLKQKLLFQKLRDIKASNAQKVNDSRVIKLKTRLLPESSKVNKSLVDVNPQTFSTWDNDSKIN